MGSCNYIDLAEAKGEAPITMEKHKTYPSKKNANARGSARAGGGGRVGAAGID